MVFHSVPTFSCAEPLSGHRSTADLAALPIVSLILIHMQGDWGVLSSDITVIGAGIELAAFKFVG